MARYILLQWLESYCKVTPPSVSMIVLFVYFASFSLTSYPIFYHYHATFNLMDFKAPTYHL